jgi:hypothetical protein
LSATPSAPSVISVPTARGCQLYGQRHLGDPEAPRVVLLHDEGTDLDSLRWLREALTAQRVCVDEWDLPGHGLSEGDYHADCGDAIAAIGREAEPRRHSGVSYVAVGKTCSYLLVTELPEPVSLTLLRPEVRAAATYPRSTWARTPTLCLVDPSDRLSDSAAQELSRSIRAWYVRAFVHDDELGRWQTHAASMTVRLVLEQHWLRVQRRRRAQGFQVEHDESTAAGQQ